MGRLIFIGALIYGFTQGWSGPVTLVLFACWIIWAFKHQDDEPSGGYGDTYTTDSYQVYGSHQQAYSDSQAAKIRASHQAFAQHQSNMNNQRY